MLTAKLKWNVESQSALWWREYTFSQKVSLLRLSAGIFSEEQHQRLPRKDPEMMRVELKRLDSVRTPKKSVCLQEVAVRFNWHRHQLYAGARMALSACKKKSIIMSGSTTRMSFSSNTKRGFRARRKPVDLYHLAETVAGGCRPLPLAL